MKSHLQVFSRTCNSLLFAEVNLRQDPRKIVQICSRSNKCVGYKAKTRKRDDGCITLILQSPSCTLRACQEQILRNFWSRCAKVTWKRNKTQLLAQKRWQFKSRLRTSKQWGQLKRVVTAVGLRKTCFPSQRDSSICPCVPAESNSLKIRWWLSSTSMCGKVVLTRMCSTDKSKVKRKAHKAHASSISVRFKSPSRTKL